MKIRCVFPVLRNKNPTQRGEPKIQFQCLLKYRKVCVLSEYFKNIQVANFNLVLWIWFCSTTGSWHVVVGYSGSWGVAGVVRPATPSDGDGSGMTPLGPCRDKVSSGCIITFGVVVSCSIFYRILCHWHYGQSTQRCNLEMILKGSFFSTDQHVTEDGPS